MDDKKENEINNVEEKIIKDETKEYLNEIKKDKLINNNINKENIKEEEIKNNDINKNNIKEKEIKNEELIYNNINEENIKEKDIKINVITNENKEKEIKKEESINNNINEENIKEEEIKNNDINENNIKQEENKDNNIKEIDINENNIKQEEIKENNIKEEEIKKKEIINNNKEKDIKKDKENSKNENKQSKIKDDILSGDMTKKTDAELDEIEDKKNVEKINKIKSNSLKVKLLSLNLYRNQIIKLKNTDLSKESYPLKQIYDKKYFDIYTKISDIVSTNDISLYENLLTEEDYKEYEINKEENTEIKPIQNFWLNALENSKFFQINDKDKEVLEFLKSIKMEKIEEGKIKLIFEFFDNDFLNNKTISKIYNFDYENDGKVFKTEYDTINWKNDNVNPSLKKKIIKVKKGKKVITKEKLTDVESFFDIFNKSKSDLENDDGEMGFFKEEFFPNLLEYFMNFEDDSERSGYDNYI